MSDLPLPALQNATRSGLSPVSPMFGPRSLGDTILLLTFIAMFFGGCASSRPLETRETARARPFAGDSPALPTEFEEVLGVDASMLGTDHPIRLEPVPTIRWRIEGVGHFHAYYPEEPGARETPRRRRHGWESCITYGPVFGPADPRRERWRDGRAWPERE